jgi:hypothetical protein
LSSLKLFSSSHFNGFLSVYSFQVRFSVSVME